MIGGYANLMWQFGLVDSLQAAYVKKQTDAAVDEINAGNYATAGQVCWHWVTYVMLAVTSDISIYLILALPICVF